MDTLVQLAGSEPADFIDAPFTLIAGLFAVCWLWRYWAASRTYVAYQAAVRRRLKATERSARPAQWPGTASRGKRSA